MHLRSLCVSISLPTRVLGCMCTSVRGVNTERSACVLTGLSIPLHHSPGRWQCAALLNACMTIFRAVNVTFHPSAVPSLSSVTESNAAAETDAVTMATVGLAVGNGLTSQRIALQGSVARTQEQHRDTTDPHTGTRIHTSPGYRGNSREVAKVGRGTSAPGSMSLNPGTMTALMKSGATVPRHEDVSVPGKPISLLASCTTLAWAGGDEDCRRVLQLRNNSPSGAPVVITVRVVGAYARAFSPEHTGTGHAKYAATGVVVEHQATVDIPVRFRALDDNAAQPLVYAAALEISAREHAAASDMRSSVYHVRGNVPRNYSSNTLVTWVRDLTKST